jgi:phosphatidate cytidylyltransferase
MARILTALVGVPLLLALILRGPAWLFLLLVLAAALEGYRELDRITAPEGLRLLPIGYASTLLLAASLYPGSLGFETAALGSVLAIGVAAVFTREPNRDNLCATAVTLLAALYVGGLLASVVGLRAVLPESDGRQWVLFLFAVVMVGDAGAYFTGRALGRHPLAPELSPKKTIEGLVGGLAASVATAVGLASFGLPAMPPRAALGLGLVLALLGVLGDLFESLLKRSVGAKDTATILPGHGGVLDRIDSLLFAAPALLAYVRFIA